MELYAVLRTVRFRRIIYFMCKSSLAAMSQLAMLATINPNNSKDENCLDAFDLIKNRKHSFGSTNFFEQPLLARFQTGLLFA